MTYVIGRLSRALTAGFNIILNPLRGFGPFLLLTILSALTGLLMVWVFGHISNQTEIKRAKSRIQASLIAVLLFQSNVSVFFRIQGRIFCLTLKYLGLSLKPTLIMIVPLLLLLIQPNGHFALRPLKVGEAAVVTVVVRNTEFLTGKADAVRLETGDGMVVETPPVRIPGKSEAAWRVRAQTAGRHYVTVHVGQNRERKSITVGDSDGFLSKRRTGSSVTDFLFHPGEYHIEASSPIRSVTVSYPPLQLAVLGWDVNWLLWFFVLSIVTGYLFKRPLGVEV